jgi:hypothetical protein
VCVQGSHQELRRTDWADRDRSQAVESERGSGKFFHHIVLLTILLLEIALKIVT